MKLKRILLTTCAALSAGAVIMSLASCGGKEDDYKRKTHSYTQQTTTQGTESSVMLSSVNLDTANVKKIYEIGEQMSLDGLVVTINLNESGKITHLVTDDYAVDYGNLNMYSEGTYTIKITCRYKTQTKASSFNVQVVASRFAATKGLTYYSGLEARVKDKAPIYDKVSVTSFDPTITYYTYNSKSKIYSETEDTKPVAGTDYYVKTTATEDIWSIIKTYKLGEDVIPAEFDKNDLQLFAIKNTVAADGTITTVREPIAADDTRLTVDSSTYNGAKIGNYKINITLNGGKVTVNGVEEENIVKSCIIISVKKNVVSVEWDSTNDKNVRRIAFNPDYTSAEDYFGNMNFNVVFKYKNGESESIPFSLEDFDISYITFNILDRAKVAQNVRFIYKQNPDVYFEQKFTLNDTNEIIGAKTSANGESFDVDFSPKPLDGKNLNFDSKNRVDATSDGDIKKNADGKYQLDNAGIFYGPKVDNGASVYYEDSEQKYSINEQTLPIKTEYVTWLLGNSIDINATKDNAYIVVIYAASASGSEREVTFAKNGDDNFDAQVAKTLVTAKEKKVTIFKAGEAGTYNISTTEGVYIYGMWVEYAK